MALINFQRIKKVYRLSSSETTFLSKIPKTYSKGWDGDLQDLIKRGILPANAKKIRNDIKKRIKDKLLLIQGENCIFCGIHFSIVGTAQREHIAYKKKFPQFTFTNANIALACASCNGFEKKSTKNVVTRPKAKYSDCEFSIIHPYFDDFKTHIVLAFDGARISLTPRNNSIKGKNTIAIFKLMEYHQTKIRAGAYLQQQAEKTMKRSLVKRKRTVTLNKYTF